MAVIQDAGPALSAPERRLQKMPVMMAVIMTLMWVTFSAEAQTILPLLSTLEKQYHMSATQGAWAISVLAIVSAAVTATLSRASDIWGVRRVLLFSICTIIIGNVISAAAPDGTLFIIGRAIAGFTAATPLMQAVFRLRAQTDARVDKNMGVMTAAVGIALVLSFLLGGIILDLGGTARTAIWVIVILGLIGLALVYLFVPDAPVRARVKLDWVGSVLIGIGLALVVVALGEANTWGPASGTTIGVLVAGVVVLMTFGAWELRVREPMIHVRLMARRTMWPAFIVSAIAAMLGTCNTLAISQFVETPSVLGYGFGTTVLVAGAILVPVGVAIGAGGPIMAPVIKRIGQRNSAVLGTVILCVNFLWFMAAHTQIWEFMVELFLLGVGFALANTAAVSGYMRVARPGESGMVSGTGSVIQIAFQALGPTLTVALITSKMIMLKTPAGPAPVPAGSNYTSAWLMMAIAAAVAIVAALLMRNSEINQDLAPGAEEVAVTR